LPLVARFLAFSLPLVSARLALAKASEVDGPASYRLATELFLTMFLRYREKPITLHFWDPLFKWPWVVLLVFLGVLLVTALILIIRWLRVRQVGRLNEMERQLLVFAVAVLLVFLLLRVEPALFHHPFFHNRRLLFTLPMLFLAFPLWLRWLVSLGKPGRIAGGAGAVCLALLAVHFALEFTPRFFAGWEFDAGTRNAARILRGRRPSAAGETAQVASGPLLSHSVEFYQRLHHMDWLSVDMGAPPCLSDFYLVLERDLPLLRPCGPKELYRDPVAHTVLAEMAPEGRARMTVLRSLGFTGPVLRQFNPVCREPWAAVGRSGGSAHFLTEVMERPDEDPQRWTFVRPAFVFDVANRVNLRFRVEFRLPAITFQQTGPIRMTVWINGRALGSRSYTSPEDNSFEQAVPPEWIRGDGLTLVETTLDKYYVSEQDHQRLGYLFLRGGFVN
jgi:hypothetical protein